MKTSAFHIILFFLAFSVLLPNCNSANNLRLVDNFYLEKDLADNVYIITERISQKRSRYVVIGDVKWLDSKKNFIFGYRKAYNTTSFLSTNESYYFALDINKTSYPNEIDLQIFPNEMSMHRFLKEHGVDKLSSRFSWQNPN